MELGGVIRKYRKMKGFTQEEMAKRLGVTPPAVNKWENGNSYPDIMMLAPIARLLGITLDTLLAFREELTEEEIGQFLEEMGTRLKRDSFEEIFQWARDLMELYPNCEKLIWQMAVILDAKRMEGAIPNSEEYEAYLKTCYVRLLDSGDETVRKHAADSLFEGCLRSEEYEKAEEYLAYFSDQDPEKKRKQGILYSKTNQISQAYQTYEEILFSEYQRIAVIFYNIYTLDMQENNRERAHMLVNKRKDLAALFDMGAYYEVSGGLELAIMEQDVGKTLEIMRDMIANVDHIHDFCGAPLYEHMKFRQVDDAFLSQMRLNLLQCFRDEETFGYLKGEKRWDELVGEEA